MTKKVTPTLFIGLGGTGHKVLLQVKKSLLSNFGEKPPVTDILCFDTDTQELSTAQDELTYVKKNGTRVSEVIRFDRDEVIGISVKSPDKLVKFQHIKSWLSDIIAPKISPSETGAKQIRQMGRFAIYENYNTQKIKEKINDKIRKLNDQAALKNKDYEIAGNKTSVHLVFSPCGGTGAGTFIDIIMILKSIDQSMPVYGWIVMPDFYTSFPMTHSVVKNAYASLMEIDHLMGKDAPLNNSKIRWSNYPKKPYEVDYTGNEKFNLGAAKFFENIYLFDNINESGRSIMDVEDIYDRIGRILFLMVTGPGFAMQSSYSNNDDYNWPSSPETNSKRRNYSSMGISQIILDKAYLRNLKINQISKTILTHYGFNGASLNQDELNTFIDANSWREDRGKDMIIDALMPRKQLIYDLETLMPSRFRKSCNTDLTANTNQFLRQWDNRIKESCVEIKGRIASDFEPKIQNEIKSYLKEKGGISHAKQFISFLSGAFQGMRDELSTEVKGHQLNIAKFQKDEKEYLESIVTEENSFIPINKRERIRETCDNYLKNTEKILIENWQLTRKEEAILFYSSCMVILTAEMKKIQDAENLVLEALSDFERATQSLMNNVKIERDFERYIHNFYKNILILNESDINLQEAFNNIDFSKILTLDDIKKVKELIQSYVLQTTAIKEVDELTVEEIMKVLPPETIKNIVSYLDSSSNTCIDIDSASFLNNSGRTTMQKFGFICVEDKDQSIFDEQGDICKHISSEGGYSELKTFTTGDADVVTMIKVAGMFPASAIKRLKDYKQQHEVSVKNGGFHFSDTYFEKYAMDLIDGPTDEEESLKWFTIGSALDKVYLHKGGIYLEYVSKQMVPLFEGTRGKTDRFQCSRFFIKNKDYVDYISKVYDNYFDDNGKPAVKEKLINFYKSIDSIKVLGKQTTSMDPKSQEFLNIYEEKKYLKEFGMLNGIDPKEFD
jgi:hypothetical protein